MNKTAYTALIALVLTACSPQEVAIEKPIKPHPAPVLVQPVATTSSAVSPAPTKPITPTPLAPSKEVPPTRYEVNTKTFRIVNPDRHEQKILLLTFDDGPVGDATLQLLDSLDKQNAKSIWFVNGHQLAKKKPDGTFTVIPEKAALLREIKKRGHLIGNHTWWHENLRKLSADKQREEIISTNEIIQSILGEKPKYFRPPFGANTDLSDKICKEEGMTSINWSVGSLDWDSSVYKKPNGITNQVVTTVHNGGNILFHDRVWTARELDAILASLRKSGFEFVLPTNVQ